MTKQFRLGDAVAKLAKILHIPHCEKCERRRLILNKIQELGVKETVKKLKAVGVKDNNWSVEDIVEKLNDCCNEK